MNNGVLSNIDWLGEKVPFHSDEAADKLREVRSAVAELIEAGRELQAAMDENEAAASRFDKSSADRFLKADARHRAALAKVQP